jgi:hypothetical protein
LTPHIPECPQLNGWWFEQWQVANGSTKVEIPKTNFRDVLLPNVGHYFGPVFPKHQPFACESSGICQNGIFNAFLDFDLVLVVDFVVPVGIILCDGDCGVVADSGWKFCFDSGLVFLLVDPPMARRKMTHNPLQDSNLESSAP